MKKLGILISAVGALLLVTTHQARSNQERVFYVSKVEKSHSQAFYARLATKNFHVIVTEQRPLNALESLEIRLGAAEELFIVEPHQPQAAPLAGEIARLDPFIVTKLWQTDESQHLHFGAIENFVTRVGHELIQPRPHEQSQNLLGYQEGFNFTTDPAFLRDKLEQLSGAKPTTINGNTETIQERGSSQGRNLSRAWLKQEYTNLGYTVSSHDYGTGINFVAERTGQDSSKTIIVSAHLDSVRNAGADDDGAGTISALAIAKALENHSLDYNLRIVGFDQEENGLIGSARYASSINQAGQNASIAGVFNIEMTGYDANKDGAYHVIDCDENTSADLSALVEQAIQDNNLNLVKSDACTNRSDHASFWRYNIPAVVISQDFFGGDSNPCYHRSCDKVDRVDFSYMAELTTAVTYAVASAVGAKPLDE